MHVDVRAHVRPGKDGRKKVSRGRPALTSCSKNTRIDIDCAAVAGAAQEPSNLVRLSGRVCTTILLSPPPVPFAPYAKIRELG